MRASAILILWGRNLLDRNKRQPLYVQLKEKIKNDIISGRISPGSKLPSTMQLAEKYSVCHKTVQLTMKALVREGLLTRRPRHGTFVAEQIEVGKFKRIGEKHRFAMLVHFNADFSSSFFMREIVEGIMSVANEKGCQVDLQVYSSFDTMVVDPSLSGFLLVMPSREATKKVKKLGIPTVVIDAHHKWLGLQSVCSDNEYGILTAVKHLLKQGHRQILYVHSDFSKAISFSGRERYSAFLKTAPRYGIETAGYTTLVSNLEKRLNGPRFTALLTDGYDATIATLKMLQKNSIAYPEDISFIGFDEVDLAEQMSVPLTVVKQQLEEVGRTGMKLLLEYDESKKKERILIKPKLMIRESTKMLLRK